MSRSAPGTRVRSRPNVGVVKVHTTGFKPDGTVVITFRRTLLVYRRGQGPTMPTPNRPSLRHYLLIARGRTASHSGGR